MSHGVHICSFEAGPKVTRKTEYLEFRAAVLKAGRFSVFEATASTRAAALYDRLCQDPDVATEPVGFPWTRVRAKAEVAGGDAA